jgi:hypothetical protein
MKTLTSIITLLLILIIGNVSYAQVPRITPDMLRDYEISDKAETIDTKSVYAEYTHKRVPEKHIETSGIVTFKKELKVQSIQILLVLFDENKEPFYMVNFAVSEMKGDKIKFVGLYEENPKYKYYVIIMDVMYKESEKQKV